MGRGTTKAQMEREGEGKGRSDDRAKLIQKMKLLYNMGSTS